MPAERRVGMDHLMYPWSPIVGREPVALAGGATVAVCPIICLQSVDFDEFATLTRKQLVAGGLGPRPDPNYALFSHLEYGFRIGIFRLVDALEKSGLPLTVAIDALSALRFPYVVNMLRDRGAEFIAHGWSASHIVTSEMPNNRQRQIVFDTLESLERDLGERPKGWLSPSQSGTEEMVDILAEHGVGYVADFANDEQPYAMTPKAGGIAALPLLLELDDVDALWYRQMLMDEWTGSLVTAARQLAVDGRITARVMAFRLHPWLVGQPFRMDRFSDTLARIVDIDGVRPSQPGDILRDFSLTSGGR